MKYLTGKGMSQFDLEESVAWEQFSGLGSNGSTPPDRDTSYYHNVGEEPIIRGPSAKPVQKPIITYKPPAKPAAPVYDVHGPAATGGIVKQPTATGKAPTPVAKPPAANCEALFTAHCALIRQREATTGQARWLLDNQINGMAPQLGACDKVRLANAVKACLGAAPLMRPLITAAGNVVMVPDAPVALYTLPDVVSVTPPPAPKPIEVLPPIPAQLPPSLFRPLPEYSLPYNIPVSTPQRPSLQEALRAGLKETQALQKQIVQGRDVEWTPELRRQFYGPPAETVDLGDEIAAVVDQALKGAADGAVNAADVVSTAPVSMSKEVVSASTKQSVDQLVRANAADENFKDAYFVLRDRFQIFSVGTNHAREAIDGVAEQFKTMKQPMTAAELKELVLVGSTASIPGATGAQSALLAIGAKGASMATERAAGRRLTPVEEGNAITRALKESTKVVSRGTDAVVAAAKKVFVNVVKNVAFEKFAGPGKPTVEEREEYDQPWLYRKAPPKQLKGLGQFPVRNLG